MTYYSYYVFDVFVLLWQEKLDKQYFNKKGENISYFNWDTPSIPSKLLISDDLKWAVLNEFKLSLLERH